MKQSNNLLRFFTGDYLIWLVVFLLFMVSMLAVYSSTGSLAYKLNGGLTSHYLFRQILLSLAGIGLMYAVHLAPYRYFSRLAQLLWALSVVALIYTLFFGTELNNARRWITLPGLGLTFQTSDFAKLALIMLMARQLTVKQEQIGSFKEAFLPLLLPVALTCVLIAPENFSTALILFFTCVFVMFVGRVAVKHIAFLFLVSLLLLALMFAIIFALPEEKLKGRMLTWKHRVENFANPQASEDDQYQVTQAKIAIAKGGFVKLNPGGSEQKNFLPHSYSDFIYAIIIEEYGSLGGAFIMFLYLFLLYRCIRIVIKSPRAFGALLALGLGIALVTQAMINMGVAVNLLPVTGVTLPLVSMGGSSVIFTSLAFGIILSVSRNVETEEEAAA